ncbi:hemerythrin domain-containing protein [Chryseobacterium sp. A301]
MIEGPIRRNSNLVPISREHHATLLFCWKLRSGAKKGIEVERLSRYVLWFYENHIVPHFKTEEDLLFTDTTDSLVNRALHEHKEIKWLVEEIANSTQDPSERIQELAGLVHSHTRYEERELFPWLEKSLHPKDLIRIGKILDQEEHNAEENYDDPFWEIEKK